MAHGQTRIVRDPPPGEKGVKDVDYFCKTVEEPLTLANWQDHLDGTGPGLGIIFLQKNLTCRFGLIDVDLYSMDHKSLYDRIEKLGLPLVMCKTKSAGAHLYVFLKEDIPATLLIERLEEWRAALQFSSTIEIFPKQTGRAKDEVGNWVNIPYVNCERSSRRNAVKGTEVLDLDQFLDYAESRSVDLAFMKKSFYSQPKGESDLFWQGPPCLVTIHAQGGFQKGSINDGMFSVAVYLYRRFGESWPDKIDEYNRVMGQLTSMEIASLVKSVSKKLGRGDGKDYTYPCKRSPIKDVCQRPTCLLREFGIRGSDSPSFQVEISSIVRYDHPPPDPPIWTFEIHGKRVMVDNDTFYSRDALNKAILAQAGRVPIHMSPSKWLQQLDELAQKADIVPMPEDASPTGQLWERIEMFLQQGVNALTKDEVFSGKVFREDGLAYFRGVDLFTYLEARRVKFKSESMVWQLLKEHGGSKTVYAAGKKPNVKQVNLWAMPITSVEFEQPKPLDFRRMDEF